MCPTFSAMMGLGARIIEVWNASCDLSIHFSEGSHGAFRLDIRSCGPGKNATVSANRVLLQQAAAEHKSRFSCAPTPQRDQANGGDGLAPQFSSRQRVGGNPYFCYLNTKRAAKKRIIAPDRPLTIAEIGKINAAARAEWVLLSDDDKSQWDAVYRSEVAARDVAQAVVAQRPVAPSIDLKNLWSNKCGDPSCLLDPEAIVKEYHRHNHAEREQLAMHDPSLTVQDPPPDRTGLFADGVGDRDAPVLSCWQSKQNICRFMLPAGIKAVMDELTSFLNAWVAALGKEKANEASALFSLHGTRSEGERVVEEVDLCALLVLPRGNPRMQCFVRCALEGSEQQLQQQLPEPPFIMELCLGASRLHPTLRSMMWQTSDELCLEAARLQMQQWRLLSLSWEEVLERPSLLPLRVVGKAEFVKPVLKRNKAKASSACGCEFDALDALGGDPMQVGRAAGSATMGTASSDVAADEVVEGCDHDDDPVGFPLDDSDVDEVLREDFNIGADADRDLQDALAGERVMDEEEVEEVEEEKELALPEHEMDHAGYIASTAEPWRWWPVVGRITSWPHAKPEHLRSVSCKCHVHHACGTPARGRAGISDDFLKLWLFSVAPEQHCTLGRSMELAAMHKAQFAPMLDAYVAEQ
jgi:hypothetical protein